MEEDAPQMNRRGSEDFATSNSIFESAEQPAPVDQYEALRVAWTPMMLASKLRTANDMRERRASAEFPEMGTDSPCHSSPSKSPNPVDRVRSHHRERPALIISPDSDRRGARGGNLRAHAGLGPLSALSIDPGSEDDTARSAGPLSAVPPTRGSPSRFGSRLANPLAVTVPSRPLSRPGSGGGPTLIVGSRASSRRPPPPPSPRAAARAPPPPRSSAAAARRRRPAAAPSRGPSRSVG